MQRHHRLPARAAIQIRMHHVADDRPGADDRHLRRRGRRSASASAAAASPSARATPPGRRRSCRPSAACRRRRDRPAGGARGRIRVRVLGLGFDVVFTSSIASCSTAIMPRPSRSTLTMPMSAQSSLSHWTTTRPGIEAGSSGTTESSAPWQIDHAARVLAEMPRQILDPQPQLGERPHPRHARATGRRPRGCGRTSRSGSVNSKLFITFASRSISSLVERQRLAHLARGAAAAIGDDVGGHRRAEPAVFLVDVLDDALAAVAARQVEIDVGPLAALLRQEALEQQIHRDRIDGRDPEAVADGAVGRRPAPLHEDVLLPA